MRVIDDTDIIEMSCSNRVADIVRAVDPSFWVPAVGNSQLGELLKFVERHNLWEAIQKAVREEE